MRALRTHGGEVRHHHTYVGLNGRFDTIQAAVLLAKFKYFEEELRLREKIAARYNQKLAECCVVPVTAEFNTHSWAQYLCVLSSVMRWLSTCRIEAFQQRYSILSVSMSSLVLPILDKAKGASQFAKRQRRKPLACPSTLG